MTDSAAIQTDGSVRNGRSVHSGSSENDGCRIDGGEEDPRPDGKNGWGCATRRRLGFLGVMLLVPVVVAIMVALTSNGKQGQEKQVASSIEDASGIQACSGGRSSLVQEAKQCELQISFISSSANQNSTTPDKMFVNSTEALLLEQAIQTGYNRATGYGCNDTESRRWMYYATMVLQEVKRSEDVLNISQSQGMVNASGSPLATTIVSTSVLALTFETGLSCDGCPDGRAFASVYPSTFEAGQAGDARRSLRLLYDHEAGGGLPGMWAGPGRDLQDVAGALDAGKVMTSITQAINKVMGEGTGLATWRRPASSPCWRAHLSTRPTK